MSPFIAVFAGCMYAALLWRVAAEIALRRRVALGMPPGWLFAGCGAAAGAAAFSSSPAFALPACVAAIGAAVCGVVDARTGLIFDALSLAVAGAAVAGAAAEHRLTDGAIAAGAIGLALLALYFATGRRGIGLGDVKLGAAIALGFGVEGGFAAIGTAFVLGAAYAPALIGTGRARRTDALRFGPFIAGGAALCLGAGLLGWRA